MKSALHVLHRLFGNSVFELEAWASLARMKQNIAALTLTLPYENVKSKSEGEFLAAVRI